MGGCDLWERAILRMVDLAEGYFLASSREIGTGGNVTKGTPVCSWRCV